MEFIRPQKAQSSQNKSYAGQIQLYQSEQYLKKYNRDLISKLTKGSMGAKSVLEFGAGVGTISNLWRIETGVTPDCYEIDPEMILTIKERGFDCYDSFEAMNKSYDVVFTSNVLEHIENDSEVIEQLSNLTNHRGKLIVYVPAFQFLYSKLDEELGHYRRYGKKELVQKLRSSGYVVVKCQYSDSIGFFAWLFTKLSGSTGDESNIRMMKIYDRMIFPISKGFDFIGFKFVFGKNLIAYCVKQDF